MKNMLAKSLATGIVAVAVLGFTTMANAIPTLSISDGNTVDTYTSATGIIQPSAFSIGVWSIVITTGETVPAIGSASSPQMSISIQATSTGAGTLYVSLSELGFNASGSVEEIISGHLVSGASEEVSSAAYGNLGNVVGTLNANGSQSNFGSLIANVPVQGMPILASATGALPGSTPYALTEYVTIVATGLHTTSIDATLTTVPDGGATVTLFGSALAGLGLMGSFFKRR